jgi:phosphatidate cytidylyltransferase
MKQRVLTALALIAVVLPSFLYGGVPFQLVVFFFILTSLYEIYAVRKKDWPFWVYLLIVVSIVLYARANLQGLFIAFILLLFGLFFLTIVFEWFTPMDVGYLFTMMVLMTSALRSVLLTVNVYGRMALIYILVVTFLTDTYAFFGGYLWGKHKINPRISPKKTVEGAITGWALAMLSGILFGYFLVEKLPLYFIIISSAVLPITSQIGDFAFSAIKRYFDVKDFGALFPAHGGVLDRIDSLVFSLMAFYVLINYFL